MDLEDKFIKIKYQGTINSTLIFGRKVKYEEMKLFPAVWYLNPLAVTTRTQSGKQHTASSLPSFLR